MSNAKPVGWWTKVFYGLGSVAFGVKDNGFGFFLLLYYNQVLGLPERWVGAGIMAVLIYDAFLDPVIGHYSDHLHSRWGRRHPFMYLSAIPVGISYYLLFSPPSGLSEGGLFAYFLVLALLVRTFVAVYEVPSSALVAELSPDYDARTSLLSYRYFFGWSGGIAMAVIAYTVFLQPDASHPVGVLNREGYRGYGLVSALVMVFAILISSIGTHGYIPRLKQPPPKHTRNGRHALRDLRQTLGNRNFVVLFISSIFTSMAAGLSAALNIYFNTYFWELTSDQISLLAVSYFLSAILALVFSPPLAARFGKKGGALLIWTAAMLLAPAPIGLRLIGWMPENGSPALLPTLIAFGVVEVSFYITASILISSMLADVVEESELVTGRRSEGMFFAARTFAQKALSGLGVFGSTMMLALAGFPRDAQPGSVAPETVANLGLVYAPTIVALYLLGLVFMFGYRIDRGVHEENLRKLAAASADS